MFAHLLGVVSNYLGSIYPFDLLTLVQFSTVQQSLFVLLAWGHKLVVPIFAYLGKPYINTNLLHYSLDSSN